MKILVDLDGIVVDMLPSWLQRIYEVSGIKANLSDITRWNLNENPLLKDIDPRLLFGILNEKNFNINLPQMPDAAHYLSKLFTDGHDISIVTARYGTNCMPETLEWIKNTMPWLRIDKKVWFCYDKHRITGDILIDDKAETLIQYGKEHPAAHLITIDYPYNKHAPDRTIRVAKDGSEWKAIYDSVSNLTKESK